MTYFQYINSNLDRVKFDIKIGLISPSVLRYFLIYSRFDYYMVQGHSHAESLQFTGMDFNIGERWSQMIIKKMESEI
jgi:hypothetical protein